MSTLGKKILEKLEPGMWDKNEKILEEALDSQFNIYQEVVTKIKNYKGDPTLYLLAKLSEETGEVAKEMVKKMDGEALTRDLTSELGDILWCITAIAEENDIKLQDIMEQNLVKLSNRGLL